MNDILPALLRGVIAYFLLLVVTRALGRKAVSQMTFFDFAVAITLGSLTTELAVGSSPLMAGVALVLFGALGIVTAVVAIKNRPLRKLINSTPVVLIAKGEIVRENLKKVRLSLDMLGAMLREKNAFQVSGVEYAVLEKNGKLSVLKKSESQPLTPSDMKIPRPPASLSAEFIVDGVLLEDNLRRSGKDVRWLAEELRRKGIERFEDVFFAALETGGALYVSGGRTDQTGPGGYGLE